MSPRNGKPERHADVLQEDRNMMEPKELTRQVKRLDNTPEKLRRSAFASSLQQVVLSSNSLESAFQGWLDPRLNGGRLLDFTTPELGEPLNVIISALSDPYILTDHGFREYSK
ncbi:hypothetical protein C0989_005565 [Termitomyces sp. Mn162]|nr:hypothetical protein C0989_005565 [Termitomyces sp. Mn162]